MELEKEPAPVKSPSRFYYDGQVFGSASVDIEPDENDSHQHVHYNLSLVPS